MSFKRRICRFDGPDEQTYVEIWETPGTYEVIRVRPFPLPTLGTKTETYLEYTRPKALNAASLLVQDLFNERLTGELL